MPQCLASPVCLITTWVKDSWYTRSVQYLISQQRLHDGTDAQTLYVSHESKTHFHGSYWVQRFWLYASFVLTSLGSPPICTKRTVKKKKKMFKVCIVSQCSNHGYISCLHPGALKAQNMWNHISDAPRLAFASMSHFKWKFDLACLHRISSSPF